MRFFQVKDCASCLARQSITLPSGRKGTICKLRGTRLCRRKPGEFPGTCELKENIAIKVKLDKSARLKCSWCGNRITPGKEIYIHVPEKKAGKDDRIYDRVACLEQYIWTRNRYN